MIVLLAAAPWNSSCSTSNTHTHTRTHTNERDAGYLSGSSAFTFRCMTTLGSSLFVFITNRFYLHPPSLAICHFVPHYPASSPTQVSHLGSFGGLSSNRLWDPILLYVVSSNYPISLLAQLPSSESNPSRSIHCGLHSNH